MAKKKREKGKSSKKRGVSYKYENQKWNEMSHKTESPNKYMTHDFVLHALAPHCPTPPLSQTSLKSLMIEETNNQYPFRHVFTLLVTTTCYLALFNGRSPPCPNSNAHLLKKRKREGDGERKDRHIFSRKSERKWKKRQVIEGVFGRERK